jgi:hypothetical protein
MMQRVRSLHPSDPSDLHPSDPSDLHPSDLGVAAPVTTLNSSSAASSDAMMDCMGRDACRCRTSTQQPRAVFSYANK